MFVNLSNLKNRPTDWLWPARIPLCSITNLESDPSCGKTTLALEIAARITSGRAMPDGAPGIPPAHVVIFSSEDDLETTIVPRLVVAGADLAHATAYDSSRLRSDPFGIPDDLSRLATLINNTGVKLLIFDPLPAFLDTASTSDARIRMSIGPLAQFAARHKCAVLAIRHFTKHRTGRAIHLGAGSIAFAAAARSVLAVVEDPNSDDQYRHVLCQTKSNLGEVAPSLAYRTVKQDGVVAIEWLGACEYRTDDLVADTQMRRSQRVHAMHVLHGILQDGPVLSTRVNAMARAAGVAKRTLDRAAHDMKLRRRKHGSGVGSFWTVELPDNPVLLAALRARDLDELMDSLCHGVPEPADDAPQQRSSKPKRNDRDDDSDDIGQEKAR